LIGINGVIKQEEVDMEKSGTTGPEGSLPAGNYSALPGNGCRDIPPEGPCFIVGIGASAGGQEPLEHIFTALPVDCNLSFVVVMHFPPDGPAFLADLLRRYTPMEVQNAEDGTPLLPNTVHVIPPGADLTVSGGRLRVERQMGRTAGTNHPIDRFFTSLAADCGNRAIAVVLSGFGTDGAEGVKRIKEGGGIVLVQEPQTAVHPPMPETAVATGAAHMVLTIEGIPLKIAEIARGYCKLPQRACLTTSLDEDLNAIFAVVKAGTGHDFSSYKKNTVMRRIERRMTVNESGGLRKYLAFLEENPREAQALAQEILIGVTRFFRDPEAFEVLRREVLPRLFADRDPDNPVRIWHACCATGEEAYSVAILVREHLEKERLNTRVQIFATDIDEGAIAQARAGSYPDDIGPDVGEERLKAFFTRSAGRWQAEKELREMILFANHNIIKDPPFSRLDLLVCRNFLIYLNPDMQKRLISLFHLVLKPCGFLFLGASETAGPNSELFAPVDKKWKIFQRQESSRREDTLFPFTTSVRKLTRAATPRQPADTDGPTPAAAADRILVERYAPACVVVNERYEVLHISSRTKPFLEIPVGAPTMEVLKMAREELRPALRAAIYKSFTERKQVLFGGVKLVDEEGESTVNVTVDPLTAHPSYGKLALVILEPAASTAAVQTPSNGDPLPEDEFSKEMLIRQMEEQLRITHEQLQFTTEQLEASNEGFMATNEELMSINEEFQSANEELQSTNEELEASKEELQALNEELVTVNAELQGKVEELNLANSDMENLFASSEIATIFLDPNLTIKRYSPAMAGILNLVPADIGRPFRHLTPTMDRSGIQNDARTVLETLVPVEREVASPEDGRRFIMRVLPYRTMEGNIDGIVVTLVDITELRRAEEAIRSAALFPLENPAPVLRIKRDGTILFVNRAAEPLLSRWRTDFGNDIPDPLRLCIEEALVEGAPREFDISAGGCCISFNVMPFPERDYANLYGRDITKRKQAEERAQRAREEWERTFDSVPDIIAILDDRHRIVRVNRAMAERLGVTSEACIGLNCHQSVHGTDAPPGFCPYALTLADGLEHAVEVHDERLGGDFLVTTTPLLNEHGKMFGTVHMARDITERKRAETEILRHVEELERFNRATVGRELRMIELKKEVNELCAHLGEQKRYPLEFEEQ
jgi:two-component system CheB/CheR fusion protein